MVTKIVDDKERQLMKLEYDKQELLDLMKDFYLLTGIRIVLFDQEYHELLSYPDHHCRFCEKMKRNEQTNQLCNESDHASFQACQKENRLIIYHCHAGLIEATAPLTDQNTVIGYMMFGQISDARDITELTSILNEKLHILPPDSLSVSNFPQNSGNQKEDILSYTKDIPLKSNAQIHAAAKIMEACTFYVMLKKTISIRRDNFIRNMDSYLTEHLSEDLSVGSLTAALGISKSKLYQVCELYYGCGIAEHIRYLRIEAAKILLSETDEPITIISDKVGFTDYNYFCRVFKKQVGVPAKKYRKENGTAGA